MRYLVLVFLCSCVGGPMLEGLTSACEDFATAIETKQVECGINPATARALNDAECKRIDFVSSRSEVYDTCIPRVYASSCKAINVQCDALKEWF